MSVLSGCPFSGNLTVPLTDASLTFNGALEHYETSLRHWPRLADFDWFFRLFWLTVFDQHNESQSYQGLVKLQLVSENLPPPQKKKKNRNTKSLSGWKLKCTSSEKLIRRWETRSKALQVIKHMVCITTSLLQAFGQWSAAWRSCLFLCSHLFEQSPRSERFHNYTEVCTRSMPGVL